MTRAPETQAGEMMARFYRIALTRDFLFGSAAFALLMVPLCFIWSITP